MHGIRFRQNVSFVTVVIVFLCYGQPKVTADCTVSEFDWAAAVGGEGAHVTTQAVSFGEDGSVYFAGDYNGTVDFDPTKNVDIHTSEIGSSFLVKLLPDGSYGWGYSYETKGKPRENRGQSPINGDRAHENR